MSITRYVVLLLLLLTLSSTVHAGESPFYTLKPAQVTPVLAELHKCGHSFDERMKALALLRVGTPYLLGCLGEEVPPDKNPLFRTDVTDCTVFVLTTCAMAHKASYGEAREMMKFLNYHNPPVVGDRVVAYGNRLHFTYDRLHGNPCFQDITCEQLPPSKLAKVEITLNRKSDGTKLLDIPWERKVTARYIPSVEITPALLSGLPGVCNVGFVRKKNFSLGLVISHEGLIIDKKWLVHANSISKKVQKQDFLTYFGGNSDYFDGIIIAKIL
jgi:hypothetical protein